MSFAATVARPGFSVADAVAELARDVYPAVDARALVRDLYDLAQPLEGADLRARPSLGKAQALAGHLHGALGFDGNRDDYGDPRNSLLSDVLARRTGLPIALSLVYVEVARRVGISAHGVGFPGHFIVRVDAEPNAPPDTVFLDPFDGGKVLSIEELARRFQRATNVTNAAALAAHLIPVEPRAFLQRWLGNLRGAYLERGERGRALVVLDRLLDLRSDDLASLRARAMLSLDLGAVAAAQADFERLATLDRGGQLGKEAEAFLARLAVKRETLSLSGHQRTPLGPAGAAAPAPRVTATKRTASGPRRTLSKTTRPGAMVSIFFASSSLERIG